MNGMDLLTTAAEGGINYWAQVVSYSDSAVTVIDREDGTRYRVTAGGMTAAMQDVLRLYPNTRGGRDIRQAVRDNDPGMIDAEAADMIFQTAALGGIVYG